MKPKRGVTVYWGILLTVYLAILFASAMVALTAGTRTGYLLVLLAAGVPIYVITSRAIMDEHDTHSGGAAPPGSNVHPFPERRLETPADVAQAAAEARAPHLRKLG